MRATGILVQGACAALLAFSAAAAPVPGTSCSVLPADNIWNTDISDLPVHARSDAWLASMSAATRNLHPDFGAFPYGLPFIVVDSRHALATIAFDYADESDPGPYPFDGNTPIEGGAGSGGDQHALMIDKDTCVLFELYDANWNGGDPTAGSGAIFDLGANALRPDTWTSADAAGLPIFPGLVRFDEVQAGAINHAIRVTASRTDRSYLWPARHQAGAANDSNLPPMGARFRLKASYDISGFSAEAQAILTALKRYGFLLADNGSDWFFQGVQDARWGDSLLDELKSVPAAQFEAVDASSLIIDPDSGAARVSGTGTGGGTGAEPGSGTGSDTEGGSGGAFSLFAGVVGLLLGFLRARQVSLFGRTKVPNPAIESGPPLVAPARVWL
jgi:hypothetical protein